MLPAEAFQRPAAHDVAGALPDVEQGCEIRSRVLEHGVGLIGGLLLFRRSLPGVLDAEGGGNDQHGRQAALLAGLDQHPRQTRIDGHARHDPPACGQTVAFEPLAVFAARVFFDRLQFDQQIEPVANAARIGGIDKGKDADVPQFQADHAQHDLGQIGPQDFGRRETGPALIARLVVEPDADTVRHAPAAAHALVGTAAGNRRHRKRCGAGAR